MVICTLEGTESLAERFLGTYAVKSDRVISLIFLNEKSHYLKITKQTNNFKFVKRFSLYNLNLVVYFTW